MREEVRSIALRAKGFLAEAEGMSLYRLAVETSGSGPCLEVGSYCGRSALFLGEGCRARGRYPLFTVDHHEGSVEQQPGQPYFDPDLYDAAAGATTTLQVLLRNIREAGLEDWVIPIVAASVRLGRYWPPATLSLVFIDGGHSEADAFGDYERGRRRSSPAGTCAFTTSTRIPRTAGRRRITCCERARRRRRVGLSRHRGHARDLEAAVIETADRGVPVRFARPLGYCHRARAAAWTMIGQDGGQSIDLGDRTLFVFSDTLLAVPSDTRRARGGAPAVSARDRRAVRLSRKLRRHVHGTRGARRVRGHALLS